MAVRSVGDPLNDAALSDMAKDTLTAAPLDPVLSVG
jgi:hypothetical protein